MSAVLSTGSTRDALFGVILIAVSATCFGAMAVLARFAYASGADVVGLLVVRFSVATLALAGIMWLRGTPLPPLSRVLALAAMGGIGYVGQSYTFFTALNHAQASLVALLLYLYPVFVTLLAALFLKEPLTRTTLAALVLCSLGAGLTVGGGEGSALGIALGVASAVIYSIYIVVGARLTRGVDSLASTTVICAASGLVYIVMSTIRVKTGTPIAFPGDAMGWAATIAIALVSTVAAILTFFAGLQKLGAARASMLSTIEPVVTVVLAAAVLGEHIAMSQAFGGALILAGVLWLAKPGTRAPADQEN
ncbi:DMT family transporter [Imbroritus primus]|uniref:DMT family transporter n=1 Tax=Imbroritus primus TaxID=3058603 RepID=A0ACD3STQ7_9BURK|nr:DMT family transporter [Burkholderiaceae bacterium PBA]